jgi:hypothetical protein
MGKTQFAIIAFMAFLFVFFMISKGDEPSRPAASIIPLAGAAFAKDKLDQKSINVIDFLVDWKSLKGKRVTVSGRQIQNASSDSVTCSAGRPGSFLVDGRTLDREGLRRALKTCAGWSQSDDCRGDVSGEVGESLGNPKLKDAVLIWAAPSSR